MSVGPIYAGLEVAQIVVAGVGLLTAVLEWSAVAALGDVGQTAAQRTLARHARWIEILRCSAHVVIIATASLSLWLPAPPMYEMPAWITEAIIARKIGVLWIALIATAGTVSSRITRLRVQATLRAQAALEA